MGKRSRSDKDTRGKKKYKSILNIIEPGTTGIYATCARKHERQATQELSLLFQEKLEEYYEDELKKLNETNDSEDGDEGSEELSIEDQIKKELEGLKSKPKDKNGKKSRDILKFIDLECECVVFCKTRRPVIPEQFVHKVMEEFANPKDLTKRTRYVQKLTPITYSCNATMPELIKLAQRVLAPHFHQDETKAYKFAIDITRRNFNTLDKMEMIKQIASEVGKNGQLKHTVDLKNFDKLVLVECFKNNIGMSVVNADYRTKFKKYNVQQLYEAKFEENAKKENE